MEIIIGIAIFAFLAWKGVKLCLWIWEVCETFSNWLDEKLASLTRLFTRLYEFIKTKINSRKNIKKANPLLRGLNKCPALGTPRAKVTFVICFIFSAITIIEFIINDDIHDLLMDLFRMMPIVVFYKISSDFTHNGIGVAFSFSDIISAGVSAMLIGWFYDFCMKDYERTRFYHWFVAFGYYIVTTITSCILGLYLSDVWKWVGETVVTIFNDLGNRIGSVGGSAQEIISLIISVAAVIIISYFVLILVLITIKEYAQACGYGLISVVLVVFFSFIIQLKGVSEFLFENPIGNIVLLAGAFILVVGTDFLRVNMKVVLQRILGDEEDVPLSYTQEDCNYL